MGLLASWPIVLSHDVAYSAGCGPPQETKKAASAAQPTTRVSLGALAAFDVFDQRSVSTEPDGLFNRAVRCRRICSFECELHLHHTPAFRKNQRVFPHYLKELEHPRTVMLSCPRRPVDCVRAVCGPERQPT